MSEEKETKTGDWMQTLWRPAMGWMYMIVCLCDMIVFPVLWSLLQASLKMPITQWNPLSLQGAGLFHIAMGAVLGIAAFGRTQEKIAGSATNASSAPSVPATSAAPVAAGSFGSGFTASTPSSTSGFGGGFTAPVPTVATVSSTGKPMPVQPTQPEL